MLLAGEGVYKLGEMYERGEGTTPDMEKAFQYYEEAEDRFNMGRMYEQGLGTKKICGKHWIVIATT